MVLTLEAPVTLIPNRNRTNQSACGEQVHRTGLRASYAWSINEKRPMVKPSTRNSARCTPWPGRMYRSLLMMNSNAGVMWTLLIYILKKIVRARPRRRLAQDTDWDYQHTSTKSCGLMSHLPTKSCGRGVINSGCTNQPTTMTAPPAMCCWQNKDLLQSALLAGSSWR